MERPIRVVLVTGVSGAGKSSALKDLEDLGYEAIDNVPLSLVPNLLEPISADAGDMPQAPLAIGVDSRTRAFDPAVFNGVITRLRERRDLEPVLLFLDASDEVLRRRFKETRRRHPLAVDRPIQDGIDAERELMSATRDRADFLIDTSDLTGHDLRRLVGKQFKLDGDPELSISVVSFSYRRGLPRDADLVIDVRFLANPFYDPALRDMSGRDQGVADYIAADPEYPAFFTRLSELILGLLPNYQREGKSYLTIAFGCTGGRHRSVFVAEQINKLLLENAFSSNIVHRDVDGDFAGPGSGNTSG